MAKNKPTYDLETLKLLIEASGLEDEHILRAVGAGLFGAQSSCEDRCTECSTHCVVCAAGKSAGGDGHTMM